MTYFPNPDLKMKVVAIKLGTKLETSRTPRGSANSPENKDKDFPVNNVTANKINNGDGHLLSLEKCIRKSA